MILALPTAMLAVLVQAGALQLATGTPRSASRSAADSQRVLKRAKEAQATFERTRRANLPLNHRGTSGRCDVRVGRFCYWWDDGEFEPPAEPPKTRKARETLVDHLAAAAAAVPGDGWIAGQRVRYLVEADRAADAVAAAEECRAEPSWCAALRGYALHAAMRFAAADSAFDAALAAMPEPDRCRWTDITLLLEGDARKRYEKQSCAERAAFETRFWALSRPLYLLPANDLRTEHFARLTMAELIRVSRYPHQMPWNDDAQELLVRYGWETGWSRELPSVSDPTSPHVVGHEPTPAFDFVPSAEALAMPDSVDASDWELHDPLAQSRYAPRYARSISDLPYQISLFRRGDSSIVVAAFDVSADTVFMRDSLAAALAAAPVSAPESAIVVIDSLARRHDVLLASVPRSPLIVSVEARDSAARRVARARAVVRRAPDSGRVTISDIMLFDDPANLPASLEDAAPRARGSLRVERNSPVGVFWEMYGVNPAGETLEFTLTVSREGVPWYRRAAERLGLADRRAPVRMKWDEPSARPGAARSRALSLDLSTLPEGRYRVELTLEAGGQPPARAQRMIEVR